MTSRNVTQLLLTFWLGVLVVSPVQGADQVVLKRTGNQVDVLIGSKPFTTFFFGPESPKPYLHPLRSTQGTIVTRGFPMVTDIPGESTDHRALTRNRSAFLFSAFPHRGHFLPNKASAQRWHASFPHEGH